jgi:SAM-dependent methyltransferase
MLENSAAAYGDRIAAIYDDLYAGFDPAALDLLSDLADNGSALELGIGTGRLAIPLRAKGVDIQGIDASEAMVMKMRAKPGGDAIPVTIGDFADADPSGPFKLIYVVFNTFFALLTQEQQVRCFQNVAERLSQGGRFLLEVFLPDLTRFAQGQTVRLVSQEHDCVRLDVSQHDLVEQLVTSTHVHLAVDGTQLYPVRLRYAWPAELDLMAQLAGLKLHHRWGDWDKRAFTNASGRHISVYGPA